MPKRILFPTGLVSFNPGSQTLEFASVPNFDCRKVMAIIDTSVNQTMLYAVASFAQGLGGTWSISSLAYPTLLTLTYDTTVGGFTGSDLLQIIYDDGEQGIHDANGLPIYSSVDANSGRNGLDVNLLNSSIIGNLNQPLADPHADQAMSVAFNHGGTLLSPRIDPVTRELITKIDSDIENPVFIQPTSNLSVSQGTYPWASVLTDNSGVPLTLDYGVVDARTLRVALASNITVPVSGGVLINTGSSTDFNSTFTTSGNSSAIASGNYCAVTFQLNIGAVSGTNPTLDIRIQESNDTTNWTDVYHFPRITSGTQTLLTPPIRLSCTNYRYVRTVGGTSPSFAVTALKIVRSATQGSIYRSFYDRTVNLNTLNSVTPAFFVGGSNSIQLMCCTNSGGTGAGPYLTIEVSEDGTNWATLLNDGTIANMAANTCYAVKVQGYAPQFARAKVTTAGGSGYTLNYISIKAIE